MTIIDGKNIALKIKEEIREEIAQKKLDVCLAVVLVGADPASQTYVRSKKHACEQVGIRSLEFSLDENVKQEKLNELLDELSLREDINAILLQLPLPKHLKEQEALGHIDPKKDVDGLTPKNLGDLFCGNDAIVPCTPKGVLHLVLRVCPDIAGKNVTVVGRSNLVGKPLAFLLLGKNASVTICHSKTTDLSSHTRSADILISAVGKRNLITEDMVKEGVIVVDVGTNRDENGKLVGDVDFENVSKKASYITPVPGGVGPMTIAMLLQNSVLLAKNQKGKK